MRLPVQSSSAANAVAAAPPAECRRPQPAFKGRLRSSPLSAGRLGRPRSPGRACVFLGRHVVRGNRKIANLSAQGLAGLLMTIVASAHVRRFPRLSQARSFAGRIGASTMLMRRTPAGMPPGVGRDSSALQIRVGSDGGRASDRLRQSCIVIGDDAGIVGRARRARLAVKREGDTRATRRRQRVRSAMPDFGGQSRVVRSHRCGEPLPWRILVADERSQRRACDLHILYSCADLGLHNSPGTVRLVQFH